MRTTPPISPEGYVLPIPNNPFNSLPKDVPNLTDTSSIVRRVFLHRPSKKVMLVQVLGVKNLTPKVIIITQDFPSKFD